MDELKLIVTLGLFIAVQFEVAHSKVLKFIRQQQCYPYHYEQIQVLQAKN